MRSFREAFADEEDFEEDSEDANSVDDGIGGEGAARSSETGVTAASADVSTFAAIDEDAPMEEDDGIERLPDVSSQRLTRHTDAVVAVTWSGTQVDLVASGSCDDRALLWRLDKDGKLSKSRTCQLHLLDR